MEAEKKEKKLGKGVRHDSARPMQCYMDPEGVLWLCDKPIDPAKPMKDQACWRSDEVYFTRVN